MMLHPTQELEPPANPARFIGKWLAYYNAERPHSTHGILTPDEAYASKIEPMRLAA